MIYSDDDDRAWRERTLPWTSIDAYEREKARGADVTHAAHVIRAFHERNNEPMGTMEVALVLGAKENENRVVTGKTLNEDEVQRAMNSLRRKKVLEWHGVAYKNNRGYWCKRSRIRLAEPKVFELELGEADPAPLAKIAPTLVVDNDRPERAQPDPNQVARDRQVEFMGWDGARSAWIRSAKSRIGRLERDLERTCKRIAAGVAVRPMTRERLEQELVTLAESIFTWNDEIGKGPTR